MASTLVHFSIRMVMLNVNSNVSLIGNNGQEEVGKGAGFFCDTFVCFGLIKILNWGHPLTWQSFGTCVRFLLDNIKFSNISKVICSLSLLVLASKHITPCSLPTASITRNGFLIYVLIKQKVLTLFMEDLNNLLALLALPFGTSLRFKDL